jgi:hypothetical protein
MAPGRAPSFGRTRSSAPAATRASVLARTAPLPSLGTSGVAPGKVGKVFVADESGPVEIHHTVPQCLLRLHDEAHPGELDGAGIEAWRE